MLRIGWFSTGRDRAARVLLGMVWREIQKKRIKAKISFVFSNRELGETEKSDLFLELVGICDLPIIRFSSKAFKARNKDKEDWRVEYDREAMRRIKTAGFRFDLCVLVGYMLQVGEEMCQRYTMINLHPAAPGGPPGTWQQVIDKLIEEKAKYSGVTMQLVTSELDAGPPVTFCTFPIWIPHKKIADSWMYFELFKDEESKRRLRDRIREEGLNYEPLLLLETLRLLGEGEIKIKEGRVLDANEQALENGWEFPFVSQIEETERRRISSLLKLP